MSKYSEGEILNYRDDSSIVKVRIEEEAEDSIYSLHGFNPDMKTLWVVTVQGDSLPGISVGEEIVALESELGYSYL